MLHIFKPFISWKYIKCMCLSGKRAKKLVTDTNLSVEEKLSYMFLFCS